MTYSYTVGIDLHGTLLDNGWRVPEELTADLTAALRSVGEFCELCLCTGNDLTFLHKHIAPDILSLFDGFVLETGCVVSDGSTENILVPREPLSRMRVLERRLRDDPLPGIEYFARRLVTISMFTRTDRGGPDPTRLFPLAVEKVEELGFREEVLVTHSDVAVDIIPAGFNKFAGLRAATSASSLIGIADSLNDLHLISDADFAFLPANASPSLLQALGKLGRMVKPLAACGQLPEGTIGRSQFGHTEAVIDILHFLRDHLP